MSRFDGVLFASDIDGTLLNRSGALSDENREAISYFMREGGRFTLITGRAPQSFERPRAFLPFNAPVVLSNGAVVYDYEAGRLLFEKTLDESALDICLEAAEAFPEAGVESYRLDGVYSYRPNAVTLRHFDYVGIKDPVFVDRIEEMPLPWLKAIFTQEQDCLLRLFDWYGKRYGGRFELVFSSPRLLEMQDVRVNKGSGLLRLARFLGIEKENVYCAGDQQNDAAMMSAVSSFAPENAGDAIKRMASYVVSDCDRHAIRDAIAVLDGLYGAGKADFPGKDAVLRKGRERP